MNFAVLPPNANQEQKDAFFDALGEMLDNTPEYDGNEIHHYVSILSVESVRQHVKLFPKCINFTDEDGFTPLHVATDLSIARLAAKEPIRRKNGRIVYPSQEEIEKRVPEMYKNQLEIIDILLNAGSDICHTDTTNDTVLHAAFAFGSIDIINKIMEHAVKLGVLEKCMQMEDDDCNLPHFKINTYLKSEDRANRMMLLTKYNILNMTNSQGKTFDDVLREEEMFFS